MSIGTSTSLRITRVVKADPERVFRAWTEPERLKAWSCPEGGTVIAAEVDLRVGGRYRITMQSSEGGVHNAVGEYREIEPPHRLVYTWDWEEDEYEVGETLVTAEFRALGGATEVILTHELFPNVEAKASHEQGWASCLNRLEAVFPVAE